MNEKLMNLSRDSNPQKTSIERRLESWKIQYKFKWKQQNLRGSLNLNCGSYSLNSAFEQISVFFYFRLAAVLDSEYIISKFLKKIPWHLKVEGGDKLSFIKWMTLQSNR